MERLNYAQMTRRRGPGRPLLFTSGYLLVWGVAGVAAYGLFHLGKSLFGAGLVVPGPAHGSAHTMSEMP